MTPLLLAFSWSIVADAAAPPSRCEFGERARCEVGCAKGELQSCYLHARMLNSNGSTPQDIARSRDLFRVGCEGGYADSCNALGYEVLRAAAPAGHSDDRGDTDEMFLAAEPHFARGCALGSAKACANMGSFLRRESLGRRKESLGFFIRACDLGGGGASTGCNEAAKTLRDGDFGEARDEHRAAELFAKACALGSRKSCAAATALGRPASLSPAAAAAITRKRCRVDGDQASCAQHVHDLETGIGIAKDMPEAIRFARLVCDGDDHVAYGCEHLGEFLLDANDRIDLPGAVSALERACEYDSARGCRMLADLVAMGQGVAANRERAITLYERACQRKAPIGCAEAGSLRNAAPSLEARSLATLLFMDGCVAGDSDSCRALQRTGLLDRALALRKERVAAVDEAACSDPSAGECFNSGMRLEEKRDREAAQPRFDAACNGGSGKGCFMLGRYAHNGWGMPASDDVALEKYVRGCLLRYAPSCVAAISDMLHPTPAARARAAQTLAEGCHNGVADACAAPSPPSAVHDAAGGQP